jgi:hypothetical protein
VTSHLQGESIPPQGVNGLIIPNTYLLDLWTWFVGLVLVVNSPQHTLHQVQQPLIAIVAIGLLWLSLEVP